MKHTEEEGINGFYGVTKEMVMNRAGRLNFPNQSYNFNYSNFGYAILSLILEAVYEKEYTTLMNEFIQNELKLSNTKISDQNGDLGRYWDWRIDDAYLAAGAITSDISAMLTYAQMQIDRNNFFTNCHKSLKKSMKM
ncbi:MAG: serine hydrolase [Lachnospiraceae bacterium]|nr:serine hydrolase [Lachnospiraceae bacterium]